MSIRMTVVASAAALLLLFGLPVAAEESGEPGHMTFEELQELIESDHDGSVALTGDVHLNNLERFNYRLDSDREVTVELGDYSIILESQGAPVTILELCGPVHLEGSGAVRPLIDTDIDSRIDIYDGASVTATGDGGCAISTHYPTTSNSRIEALGEGATALRLLPGAPDSNYQVHSLDKMDIYAPFGTGIEAVWPVELRCVRIDSPRPVVSASGKVRLDMCVVPNAPEGAEVVRRRLEWYANYDLLSYGIAQEKGGGSAQDRARDIKALLIDTSLEHEEGRFYGIETASLGFSMNIDDSGVDYGKVGAYEITVTPVAPYEGMEIENFEPVRVPYHITEPGRTYLRNAQFFFGNFLVTFLEGFDINPEDYDDTEGLLVYLAREDEEWRLLEASEYEVNFSNIILKNIEVNTQYYIQVDMQRVGQGDYGKTVTGLSNVLPFYLDEQYNTTGGGGSRDGIRPGGSGPPTDPAPGEPDPGTPPVDPGPGPSVPPTDPDPGPGSGGGGTLPEPSPGRGVSTLATGSRDRLSSGARDSAAPWGGGTKIDGKRLAAMLVANPRRIAFVHNGIRVDIQSQAVKALELRADQTFTVNTSMIDSRVAVEILVDGRPLTGRDIPMTLSVQQRLAPGERPEELLFCDAAGRPVASSYYEEKAELLTAEIPRPGQYTIQARGGGAEFTDMSDATVRFAVARGLLTGYGDKTFRPAQAVTFRQAYGMMAAVRGGAPAAANASDKPLTRGELALLLYRYFQEYGYSTDNTKRVAFADDSWTGEQSKAIHAMTNAGLFSGGGTFGADETVTRYECAGILRNAFGKLYQ